MKKKHHILYIHIYKMVILKQLKVYVGEVSNFKWDKITYVWILTETRGGSCKMLTPRNFEADGKFEINKVIDY